MYEPWVDEIALEEFSNGDILDPDRPRGILKATAKRRERAAFSSVGLIKCKEDCKCIRQFFADYLGDASAEGIAPVIFYSLTHNGVSHSIHLRFLL